MEKIVMDEEHFGQATTKSSGTSLTVFVPSISDLPQEVMELIFGNIDSISHKRIERVCKGWMEIIRGVRKFRTNIQFEYPTYYYFLTTTYSSLHYQMDIPWRVGLRDMVKHMAVLHFKSYKLPVKFERIWKIEEMMQRGVHNVLRDLTNVIRQPCFVNYIAFTDCTIDFALWDALWDAPYYSLLDVTRKIRIIRSKIAATDRFGRATLYVEDLWLETRNGLVEQIGKLFLAEHGPLTEKQSAILLKIERRLTIDVEPDRQTWLIQKFEALVRGYFNNRVRYVDGYDSIVPLTTIAHGGHVSKHTADLLGGLIDKLGRL